MNHLGITLGWLAVQVTVVALAGLCLTALLARRAPAAGAAAALTALAATVLLAALACCPLPSWWAWDRPTPVADAAPPAHLEANPDAAMPAERPAPAAEPRKGGLRLAALLSALRWVERGPGSAASSGDPAWSWLGVAAAVSVAGAALGLLRLLVGLWAVRRGWHRSVPVAEPGLLRLVEELRGALNVTRAVAVRQADDLATAATVGWRRPVLLLPPDWHGWTGGQCRAVVAHELAHVGRGDFAAWLLARLSVALHFWHPLVRALAGRLHLQQELAADAAAAPLAGGPPAYLRALAELTLRADGLARGWPAPAFLSREGTLLRRVEMLRVTDDGAQRLASRTGRRLMIALFLAVTLLASALRGPGRQALAAAPDPAAKRTQEKVTPFDLSLVALTDDKDAGGVYGVRPAALLKRPGMAPMLQLINAHIDTLGAALNAGGVGLHAEDVEQVMGRLYLGGENKPGKRSLMLSMNVLRTTRDVDWVKLRDQCGPKVKQHRWKGQTYVSFPMPALLRGITGARGDGYLWAPDSRTLVCDSEEVIKARIEARAAGRRPALPAYAAGWDLVSRGLLALALDNHGGRLVKRCLTDAELKGALADPHRMEYHLARFSQNVSGVVAGFAGGDDGRFDLRASADNADAAATMSRSCEALLAAARKAVRKAKPGSAAPEQAAAALCFGRTALDRAAVRRAGAVVTVHAEVASGLNAVLTEYARELARDAK
jgi:beta-lactamase regulating signal transducer with metallopeptidase domain